jgi:hypothetical protein
LASHRNRPRSTQSAQRPNRSKRKGSTPSWGACAAGIRGGDGPVVVHGVWNASASLASRSRSCRSLPSHSSAAAASRRSYRSVSTLLPSVMRLVARHFTEGGHRPRRSAAPCAVCLPFSLPSPAPSATELVPRESAKLLSLVRKRGLVVATADRSRRMPDNGIEHLFRDAAAETDSLKCVSPRVVG